jgi:hypothetical protein
MLYFGLHRDRTPRVGGSIILEVLRQTWGRLIHKQWLVFYPLALGVFNLLAFLSVYAATGSTLGWSPFFAANHQRWQFVRDTLVDPLVLGPELVVAAFAGLCVCVLAATIRAPFFRAVGGTGYPMAPRGWRETGWLSLFYLFSNLVIWVLPFAGTSHRVVGQVIGFVVLVVAILSIFADYIIVFEQVDFLTALQRSLQLFVHRWLAMLVIFVLLQLAYLGLAEVYDSFYDNSTKVSIVLPIVQIVVDAFVMLVVDLILIFLYQQTRRGGHR